MAHEVTDKIVLGSQSPRRRELLSLIVPEVDIVVCPPLDSEEPGFENCQTFDQINDQLRHIAKLKNYDVTQQLRNEKYRCLITADTVVIAELNGHHQVLGKPVGRDWKETVRNWFRNYLCGHEHQVVSAVCISTSERPLSEFTVSTTVRFCEYEKSLVDWYINTEEPLGKAGGYGLQAGGSLFAEQVTGSLSNVIGLPIKETQAALNSLNS